jgi:ABC-type multidrug transport system fused ATPase/permease subunit
LALFIGIAFISNMFSGNYFFQGFYYSINMRKAIVLAMFNKVAKLSLKSLAETNSGKLITLISSDIFTVERNMQFAPLIISAPISNICAYILIGLTSGWRYSAIVFGLTVVMVGT